MISRLKIQNYKSIEEMELNFGMLNALIGKNGAGKTTLISAINLMRRFSSGENINSIINSIAPLGEFFNANLDSKKALFEADIITPQEQLVYTYKFSVTFGPGSGFRTHIGRNMYYVDEESLYKKDLSNSSSSSNTLIFKRVSGSDPFHAMSIQTGSKKEDLPFRITAYNSVLSVYAEPNAKNVADTLSSYSIIWMDNPASNQSISLVSTNDLNLSTVDGVAVSLFLKDDALYEKAMSSIKNIIDGFIPPIIQKIPSPSNTDLDKKDDAEKNNKEIISNYIVYWHDSAYAKRTDISQFSLSGGNSRVIYLILSLYNNEAKSCFIAEEIENGMHSERIEKLTEQIRMISKNQSVQIFFTTHSHTILNYLTLKEIVFVKLSNTGSTYRHLDTTDEYKEIRESLNRAPSSMDLINSGLLY